MQDLILTPQAAEKRINRMRFDDEATGLQALISGQIDVGGTGLLVNQRLNRNDPGKNYEVKIVLRPLHFGIGSAARARQAAVAQHVHLHDQEQRRADAISRKWRELPLGNLPVF